MLSPFRVMLFALGALTPAAAQQAAEAKPPVSEVAARARLDQALAGFAQRGAVAVDLSWQETVRNVPSFDTKASGTCTSDVLHLRHGAKEWLVSARNDLVRVDDAWLGAKGDERGSGFVPDIVATLKGCVFEVLRREAGMLDDRPVETFSLRVPDAAAARLAQLAKPPLLRHDAAMRAMTSRLKRAAAVVEDDPPVTDVAVAIDPAVHEIRSVHVRFTLTPAVEGEPSDWRDGLPVRSKATFAVGLLVRLTAAAPGAMPALDMDLRTRLRLGPTPPK